MSELTSMYATVKGRFADEGIEFDGAVCRSVAWGILHVAPDRRAVDAAIDCFVDEAYRGEERTLSVARDFDELGKRIELYLEHGALVRYCAQCGEELHVHKEIVRLAKLKKGSVSSDQHPFSTEFEKFKVSNNGGYYCSGDCQRLFTED